MDSTGSLHTLLPDIQEAISDGTANVQCSVELPPDLTELPFSLQFRSLGKRVHLLQPSSPTPKDFHPVTTLTDGRIVVTDGVNNECLHLVLEGQLDWISKLHSVFSKKVGITTTDWHFLVLELCSGQARFHVLHDQSLKSSAAALCKGEKTVLWLTPLVNGAPSKPKLVKKVVKKSGTTNSTTGTGTKGTKTGSGTKVVRKKVASASGEAKAIGESKSDESAGSNIVISSSFTKITKTDLNGCISDSNGDGSVDSGISLVDSDIEKSPPTGRCDQPEQKGASPDVLTDCTLSEFVTPSSTPDSGAKLDQSPIDDTEAVDESLCATFTLRLPPTPNRNNESLRQTGGIKMERIVEEEEKLRTDGATAHGMRNLKKKQHSSNSSSGSNSSRSSSISNDKLHRIRKNSLGRPLPTSLPILNEFEMPHSTQSHLIGGFANSEMPPVMVLQLVLKHFTFKELGQLRLVHPHWDELCGQLLNIGYLGLLRRAELLLAECQRRILAQPELHDVLASLTNIQVHILNPVDTIRPAIDEGVCCFPYGELLDKITVLINDASRVMKGQLAPDTNLNWKAISEQAQQAQVHYRINMKNLMEEKLGEVVQLKAMQSLQRIDSFMIESTVNKLEKAAYMARDELEWKIEQLKNQNVQLKKDNRELKKDCMRMESRIEILENKFKTMARLLQ